MARLPRKTHKIFCSNPTSENQTSVFGTMKTTNKQYSTDVETLQSNEAYEQGWKSATIANYKPFMEDFNTLNYINTSQLAYLFQQGVAEWDSATTYYKNNFVAKDGLLYVSKTDDNTNNNPATDENNWEVFASGGKGYTPPLFMPQWADHELDNTSFLRADTFSWHDGTTYSNGYNELLSEYNNSASTTKTDTIGTVTITYKLTPKGYKICAANQLTNLTTLYNNTGIAWYYVLDTANKQFKLPRTKWGFKGLRDNVGNTIAESLPNIKGSWTGAETFTVPKKGTGAITWINAGGGYSGGGGGAQGSGFDFNASDYDPVYQDGAHVQEQGTQMYLYFYIGQYTPEAVEQTAGLNTELFNNKMDRDMSNRTSNIHFVTETYQNGTSWYRIYSDNWCEQGGFAADNATVTFLKAYTNNNYTITAIGVTTSSGSPQFRQLLLNAKSATGFTSTTNGGVGQWWQACGYIA